MITDQLLTDAHQSHYRSDGDIAMQVCEPYDLHKTKLSEENRVYDECQMSPDAVYETMPQ